MLYNSGILVMKIVTVIKKKEKKNANQVFFPHIYPTNDGDNNDK